MSDYPEAEDKAEKRSEQLKAMLTQAKALSEARDRITALKGEKERLVKENTGLKELLLECKKEIEWQGVDSDEPTLEKINNVFNPSQLIPSREIDNAYDDLHSRLLRQIGLRAIAEHANTKLLKQVEGYREALDNFFAKHSCPEDIPIEDWEELQALQADQEKEKGNG